MTWENCSSVHGQSCLMLDRKFVVIKRCGPESESAAGSETWLVYKGRFTTHSHRPTPNIAATWVFFST